MKKLLLENREKPMEEQKKILLRTFRDWIEPYGAKQVDDIIMIGIRL